MHSVQNGSGEGERPSRRQVELWHVDSEPQRVQVVSRSLEVVDNCLWNVRLQQPVVEVREDSLTCADELRPPPSPL